MQLESNIKAKNKYLDRTFYIWLSLIGLTLASAAMAESKHATISATFFVCAIVIIKGSWVIDEFMGLKLASGITRFTVKFYFYAMTSIVGLSIIYNQSKMTIH